MSNPIGKLKLSRSELIFCGLLLLGAAGFGIYRLDQALYKAREPQIFEEATQTVSLGETLSLTHRTVGREHNFIPWDGVVEMTIQKVALYPSYTDARDAGENVANPNGLLHDESDPFLVVEVEVTNVNAEEGDYEWRHADVTGISGSDGAITLKPLFRLNTDVGEFASSLWCVNGVSSSSYDVSTDVPQGETVYMTLGFTLEDGAEEHLDGATLLYSFYYDRMDIGSPTLGGDNAGYR